MVLDVQPAKKSTRKVRFDEDTDFSAKPKPTRNTVNNIVTPDTVESDARPRASGQGQGNH